MGCASRPTRSITRAGWGDPGVASTPLTRVRWGWSTQQEMATSSAKFPSGDTSPLCVAGAARNEISKNSNEDGDRDGVVVFRSVA